MKKLLASALVLAAASLAVPAIAADTMSPTGGAAAGSMPGAANPSQQGAQGTMSKSDLLGRTVVDSKGKQVGQVKDVVTDPQGAPLNVIVATSKKDVSLSADEIKLASNDTLKASKTAKEINLLPPAPATSPEPTGSTAPMNVPGTTPSGGGSSGSGSSSAPY